MRFQPKWSPWCGPTTLYNAAYLHGIKVGIQKVVELCGPTHEGTPEERLIAAANKLGFVCATFRTDAAEEAKQWALGPCQILCVDQWDHWVLVHGVVNDRYMVIDPENSTINKQHNGHRSFDWRSMSRKWRRAGVREELGDCTYYGISLYRA